MSLRRQFELPEKDVEFLEAYGRPWEAIVDGSQWVLIHDFESHQGYNHPQVTVAIRIESGYPITPLDMVYVNPSLARRDGKPVGKVAAIQSIDGKTWQRWSRHRTPQNPWVAGVDCLEHHVYLIEDWFIREFNHG